MRIIRGLTGAPSASETILKRFQPVGFTAPGATGSFNGNTYSLNRTPATTAAVQGVTAATDAQAQALAGLRSSVAPGFGQLSQSITQSMQSRINAIRDTARSTIGGIRENLARRRLAGSSFQQSEVATAAAEFAKQEDQARADAAIAKANAFIQEIGLSQNLIKDQFNASLQGAQTVLQQLNFDTSTVTQLAGLSSQLINQNLTAQAEFRDAQAAAGEDFLGTIIGIATGGK